MIRKPGTLIQAMIWLQNLCKSYVLRGARKVVARNLNAEFPSGVTVALLGRNGAGKSSLLAMIAGTLAPDSGRVVKTGSVSWPVGFAGAFHPELTGAQNTRFVARIYGVDTDSLLAFVEDFAELGRHFHLPFHTYSSGMKGRLSFGVSMGIRFDTYLVDESTATGDGAFKTKARLVFNARMRDSGALVVTHSMAQARAICQAGAVLEDGRLTYFDRVEDAIAHHDAVIGGDPADG